MMGARLIHKHTNELENKNKLEVRTQVEMDWRS
jgi:hypothetical protein